LNALCKSRKGVPGKGQGRRWYQKERDLEGGYRCPGSRGEKVGLHAVGQETAKTDESLSRSGALGSKT